MSSALLVDLFFFKQKTAYELRISDWSSDVCSSDLLERQFRGAALDMTVLFDVLVGCRVFLTELTHLGNGRLDVVPVGSNGTGEVLLRDLPGDGFQCCFCHTQFPFFRGSAGRSEEHTSELQSLMRISFAGFFLQKKK